MAEHIISLQGVTKEFDTKGGKVVALKDINLDIEEGDSYGIIGLSGAGKSTLVRTINLLEQPTEGKVLFNGNALTGLKGKDLNIHRRKISMIFQQFNLLMQRDAIGNIMFPLEIAGVPKPDALKKAKELLKVAIPIINNTFPETGSCWGCANYDEAKDECKGGAFEKCSEVCKWEHTDEALKLIES